ncbi:hypothetical protein IQ235_11230 [Oscillatoriales cyanobacterium LEGE 11467]|uniref:Uncharacterized protein n=1 Tax=Zarconia navalis LEGE 11467 TaxID=1828826 RepID=A0A928W003_9CYAN|nr:hypothetical protein [Zarconia navalis]MBE9041353.1 hypothetical protein [Zarconia navalis LEGE 11467]
MTFHYDGWLQVAGKGLGAIEFVETLQISLEVSLALDFAGVSQAICLQSSIVGISSYGHSTQPNREPGETHQN